MSSASMLSEAIDFMAELKVSELSAVERVEVLKKFLADNQVEDDNVTYKSIRDKLLSDLDFAHFESITPW